MLSTTRASAASRPSSGSESAAEISASTWAERRRVILAASSWVTASLAPAYSEYDDGRMWPPFRPVAPEHACRASSMAILSGVVPLASLRRCHAMLVPEMPEPMMTTSASAGSCGDWWSATPSRGGSCQ